MISYKSIADVWSSILAGGLATVRWEIPAATFIYLMAANGLFWYSVLFIDRAYQISFLMAVCLASFSICVLFPIINSTHQLNEIMEHCRRFVDEFASLSSGQKIVFLFVNILAFPFVVIFGPAIKILNWIWNQKFFEVLIMISSGLASVYLFANDLKHACFCGYFLLLIILVLPTWKHNKLTETINLKCITFLNYLIGNVARPLKANCERLIRNLIYVVCGFWMPTILNWADEHWIRFCQFFNATIIGPFIDFCRQITYCLTYLIFGYWIYPLKRGLTKKIEHIANYTYMNYILPIRHFIIKTFEILTYYLCGHWITPLIQRIDDTWQSLLLKIRICIIHPIVEKYEISKQFFVYWIGGYWIPTFNDYCQRKYRNFLNVMYCTLIRPVVNFFANFTTNMIYVLSFQWIFGLLDFAYLQIYSPLINAIFCAKDFTLYVVYGYWITDFQNFIALKYTNMKFWIRFHFFEPSKVYVRNFIRRKKLEFLKYMTMLMKYSKRRLLDFRLYLMNNCWKSFQLKTRRFLIKSKLYVKYKIFLPAVKNALLGAIYLFEFLCVSVLVPLCELCFSKLYDGTKLFMDNYGYTWYDKLVEQMPERSPFLDDSDTELGEFLPSDLEQRTESESGSLVDSPSVRRYTAKTSVPLSSEDEEEAEFTRNLQIPGIDHSDSDEDKEELAMAPELVKKCMRKNVQKLENAVTNTRKIVAKTESDHKAESFNEMDVVEISKKSMQVDESNESVITAIKHKLVAASSSDAARTVKDALSNVTSYAWEKAGDAASNLMNKTLGTSTSIVGFSAKQTDYDDNDDDESQFALDVTADFEVID